MSRTGPAFKTEQLSEPEEMITRLVGVEPQQLPVVSLYLDGRVDEHGRRNFEAFVRKRLTERARRYEAHTPERKSLDSDLIRITDYLKNNLNSSAHGIVIFTCSGANGFFEAAQFAAPVDRHQLYIYDRPHLYPLTRLMDQYQRYVVVLADTNVARLFVFASGRTVEQKDLQNVKTKSANIGGWTHARYQRHVENYHIHHAKEIVEVLERTVREEAIERIILAGDGTAIISLLRAQMPKELSEKVIDVLTLGIDTPESELFEKSMAAYRRYDSLSDAEKVEHLLNEHAASGLAVVGAADTLAALTNGQVEELLIASSTDSLHYDEAEVAKVFAAYTGVHEPPATLDRRVVAEELVRRANRISSARVTFIEDAVALERVGGVGALLRYRVSAETAAPYEQSGAIPQSEALAGIPGEEQ